MSTAQSLSMTVRLSAIDKLTAPMQSMLKGSQTLSKGLKEARDRLKDLEKQSKLVESFRTTSASVGKTANALKNAQAKVKTLADQIAASEKPTKGMVRAFELARGEAQRLKFAHTQLTQKQQRLRDELTKAGHPTKQLASYQRDLKQRMSEASAAIQEQSTKLEAHNAKLQKWYAARAQYEKATALRDKLQSFGVRAMVGGVAMGAPLVKMVRDFATFEDAMLGVAKQMEGARDDAGRLTPMYYAMADAIRALSTDARIGQSATDIAALVEAGARMGIQGRDDLLQYARTAGMAATAFDAVAGEIGQNIAKVAGLYKIPIANIEALGDTINWLDDKSMAGGADIIEVLTRIAGITQTVNMSFRDSAALGSTFLSLGASAEVAATATNAVIRELAVATQQPKRFRSALKSIGLTPDAVQVGMLKDSTGTILRVLEAIKALPAGNQLAATVGLFGKEFGDDVAKLATNLDDYREHLRLANDEQARGSMAREADARAMALSARWQTAMNRLFNAGSRAGETLKGTLVGILEAAGNALDALDGWMQRNPALTSALMHVAAALAAIVTGLGALAMVVAAVVGPIAVLRLGLAFIAPLLAGISLPALAVVGAVAAVGAAAWALYHNWDAVWSGIKALFSSGVEFIVRLMDRILDGVLAPLRAAMNLLDKIPGFERARSVDFGSTFSFGGPSAAPLRAAGAGGSVTTSNTITINPAPGQSPQDIGREVGRQLDERERARQARRRSILGDVD